MAQSQQQPRVGFFQLGACLRHAVDLRQNLGVVRVGGIDQRVQNRFLFFERGVKIDQPQPVLLEHLIHLLLLVGGEVELPR